MRHEGGLASSIQAPNGTNMETEMSDIARETLLNNEVDIMTYFIKDESMKNCSHIHA